MVHAVYKHVGITPLQVIDHYRLQFPQYKHEKIGYAGRLDPMAEGVLLLLIGDDNKRRREFEKLPKEYEFEVLFGIETDSYDVVGKIINTASLSLRVPPWRGDEAIYSIQRLPRSLSVARNDIVRVVPTFIGKQIQVYPPYSSPKVNGKPLFKWAREGKISEIEIPKKNIEIYSFELLSNNTISGRELAEESIAKISRVQGVFRQDEIIEGWLEFERKYSSAEFPMYSFKISCSSGTYVRSIAHEIGKSIQTGALASSIKRTRIGGYAIDM